MSLHALTKKQFFELTSPKKGKVVSLDFSDTGLLLKTPSNWLGRIINMVASNCDLYLLTGETEALSITVTARASVDAASREITCAADSPAYVPMGYVLPVYFDETDVWFYIKAASGLSGTVFAYPGSPSRSGSR